MSSAPVWEVAHPTPGRCPLLTSVERQSAIYATVLIRLPTVRSGVADLDFSVVSNGGS